MELAADEMTDIYFGSMYAPAVTDVSDHLLDMSAYPFTDNFTDQRLREVTDDGHIYMLPLYYSVLGITYNKTLLDEHGWTLPTSLEELEALAPQVEGRRLALDQVQFPGYGFQYLFNILSAGYANTIEGRKWQNSFLAGEENALDNARPGGPVPGYPALAGCGDAELQRRPGQRHQHPRRLFRGQYPVYDRQPDLCFAGGIQRRVRLYALSV